MKTRLRAQSRGYTAVEILMAMTMLAIGGAAVIGMQTAAVQGNLAARQQDMANAIARETIDRLHRDASQWTLPNRYNSSAGSNIANAKYLNGRTDNRWYRPDVYNTGTVPDGTSAAFDLLGRDLKTTDYGVAAFCVHYRLRWLTQDQLLRAEVRVVWPRRLGTEVSATWCSLDPNTAAFESMAAYNAVYTASAIRKNNLE
jgi:Tfp pilus assembly protein PilV